MAANAYDALLGGGVADLRPTPARDRRRGAAARRCYRYLRPDDAAGTRDAARCCSCRRSPRRRSASTCGAAARWPSTCSRSATRPTCSTTARSRFADRDLGLEHWIARRPAAGDRAASARTPAARRCSSSAGAWAGSCRCSRVAADRDAAGRLGGPGREPVRLRARAARGAAAPAREPHRRRARHGALPRARRRAGAARAARASSSPRSTSSSRKPLAVATHLDDRDFLAQIEAVDSFIAQHARLPGPHLRPALPPLLPRQRPRRRAASTPRRRRRSTCADVRVPVLAVAGDARRASRRAPPSTTSAACSPTAPEVHLRTAPGGHLGVLTGRAARTSTWAWIDAFFAGYSPRPAQRPLRAVA